MIARRRRTRRWRTRSVVDRVRDWTAAAEALSALAVSERLGRAGLDDAALRALSRALAAADRVGVD